MCVCAGVSSCSVKSNQISWFGAVTKAGESLDCHTQRIQYVNLDLFERTLGS